MKLTRLPVARFSAQPAPIVAIRRHQTEGRRTNHFPEVGVLDRDQVRRYLTFMRTTVSSKGQIVLPAEFRQMDGVQPGQEFDVERLDRGDYRLVRRVAPPNEGAIDWLLACPHKEFFVPIDSESTDAL